jgi:outer membrane protein assembly factor BamB
MWSSVNDSSCGACFVIHRTAVGFFLIMALVQAAVHVQCSSVMAEDWPWFLGPRHTGESGETDLKPDWTEKKPAVIWKQSIGTGYSAPSLLGDRLVVHHRQGDSEVISCRNRQDGVEIWKYEYASEFEDPYGYNNGPRCSPILTAEACYTLGAEGKLVCVSMKDGKLRWEVDLRKDFRLPEWFFGMGCSPLLDGNQLIVLVGGQPDSGVVSFDSRTGKVLWQSVGKSTWDGTETPEGETYRWTGEEMVVSYSSPVIAEIHGQRHLLCLVRQGLVSLNPETGKKNFAYWFRSRVHESVNAARPVVIGDQIFLSAAYQVGSALLKVEADGQSVTEVWTNRRNLLAHWSTPIHVEGFIYGFTGRHENEGELRCVQLSDGAVKWGTSGFDGDLNNLRVNRANGKVFDAETGAEIPYPFYGRGALTRIGDRFVVLGERGTLAVIDVNSERYQERGRFSLDEIGNPAWVAPVISEGCMYLRSEKWLVCLDLKDAQKP